jgi:hypothetical protein
MNRPEPIFFRPEVKILTIAEIEDGKPCLVIEFTYGPNCGQINFLEISINKEEEKMYLNELSDTFKGEVEKAYDPVKKFISQCFKVKINGNEKYRQVGVALRASGNLDFFWNYRIVDSFEFEDRLFDGYIEDI